MFRTILKQTLDDVVKECKMNYIGKIDITFDVDSALVSAVSDYINRDIYIFDVSDRLITNEIDVPAKLRKSIIVMRLSDGVYEPLCRLINSTLLFTFYKDDPLIKRLYTFKYKPELVLDLYPNLLQYLPEKYSKLLDKFSKRASRSPKRRILFKPRHPPTSSQLKPVRKNVSSSSSSSEDDDD